MTDIKEFIDKANLKVYTLYEAVQFIVSKVPFWLLDNLGRKLEVEDIRIGEMYFSDLGVLEFNEHTEAYMPFWLRIKVDGVYLNGDGWYGWINPNLLVPDGTKNTVETEEGDTVEIDNYKIDPLEALFNEMITIVGGN